MADEAILLGIEGGIARITLNRPDRLNSFNDAMHAQLRKALDRVKPTAEEVKANPRSRSAIMRVAERAEVQ
jgi:2-(1,2-epoxy-1,2-dihydrophenyl)acetyl-CoA isomerase